MVVSLAVFGVYCAYIRKRTKTPNYDSVVREHYKNTASKQMHDQCVKIVHSVWDINKYRNTVTSRLFDLAVYESALIVPLLRQCRESHIINREHVVSEGECEISGDCVANRAHVTIGEQHYFLRSDIADAVTYFHVLTWYPLYMQSAYETFMYVDEEKEYNLLCFMHNTCEALILAHTR